MKYAPRLNLIGKTITVMAGLTMFGTANAFNPQPEPPKAVPVGMIYEQTVGINVGHPPDPIFPDFVPVVQLGIYDASGKLLRTLRTKVSAGQVVSMELSGRELGLRGGERLTIYGISQCLGNAVSKARCAQTIKTSMELFDTETGKTEVIFSLGGPAVVPIFDNKLSTD